MLAVTVGLMAKGGGDCARAEGKPGRRRSAMSAEQDGHADFLNPEVVE
jgi:hypothetical protein